MKMFLAYYAYMVTDIVDAPTMVYFGALGNRIEGRYLKQKKPTSPAVLILPPDPRYGGSIKNKIVKMLEKIFQDCNLTTLAINYQGSGKSEGRFQKYENGLETASISLDWLQAQNADASHFWIAGYSFGACVAADLGTRRPEIENFVFVSPLIKQYDISFMCPALCDGLIVTGEKDEFINNNDLNKLVSKMNEGCNIEVTNLVISEAGHRFDKEDEQLATEIANYVNIKLATRIAKPVRKKRRKRQKKEINNAE